MIFAQTASNCGTDPFYSGPNGSYLSKVVAEMFNGATSVLM